MKSKDQILLEEAYTNILDEDYNAFPPDDIFEIYEEVGMSAEMAMQELISTTVQQILKEVPQEDQGQARVAVKGLWIGLIKNWSSLKEH